MPGCLLPSVLRDAGFLTPSALLGLAGKMRNLKMYLHQAERDVEFIQGKKTIMPPSFTLLLFLKRSINRFVGEKIHPPLRHL